MKAQTGPTFYRYSKSEFPSPTTKKLEFRSFQRSGQVCWNRGNINMLFSMCWEPVSLPLPHRLNPDPAFFSLLQSYLFTIQLLGTWSRLHKEACMSLNPSRFNQEMPPPPPTPHPTPHSPPQTLPKELPTSL